MQFKKTGLAVSIFAFLFLTAPASAQEVVLSSRPGINTVPVYDAPSGKKRFDVRPIEIVNRPVRGRAGAWLDVGDGWWVPSSDVVTGSRSSGGRSSPSDTSRGSTMGTPGPR
jgi:hypothetical protein